MKYFILPVMWTALVIVVSQFYNPMEMRAGGWLLENRMGFSCWIGNDFQVGCKENYSDPLHSPRSAELEWRRIDYIEREKEHVQEKINAYGAEVLKLYQLDAIQGMREATKERAGEMFGHWA